VSRYSPSEILRRHVRERRLRASIRAIDIARDPASTPLMSEEAWVDSLLLVRGVPRHVLDMLEAWVCESAGATWEVDVVVIRGEVRDVPTQQVAQRLTLREAAERVGMLLNYQEARALHTEAIATVTENLIKRASAEEAAA
jgi:hypothetical protein